MTKIAFKEAETEALFDDRQRDKRFENFWDPEGSLHWGYFENLAQAQPEDFVPACERWDQYMLERSGINAESKVLEIACGNGKAAISMAQQTGCEVVGIDLSGNQIRKAEAKASQYSDLKLSFYKQSATKLSFPDSSFSHVWSQGSLYHIHELAQALAEAARVLQPGGIFLFDDLVSPKPLEEISEDSRKYVYERLLFEPRFTPEGYAQKLTELGLVVKEQKDLSQHLEKSYQLVSELAKQDYPDMSAAFEKTRAAVSAGELSWYFYLCEKQR